MHIVGIDECAVHIEQHRGDSGHAVRLPT
jgi:hypothetical protein